MHPQRGGPLGITQQTQTDDEANKRRKAKAHIWTSTETVEEGLVRGVPPPRTHQDGADPQGVWASRSAFPAPAPEMLKRHHGQTQLGSGKE